MVSSTATTKKITSKMVKYHLKELKCCLGKYLPDAKESNKGEIEE